MITRPITSFRVKSTYDFGPRKARQYFSKLELLVEPVSRLKSSSLNLQESIERKKMKLELLHYESRIVLLRYIGKNSGHLPSIYITSD